MSISEIELFALGTTARLLIAAPFIQDPGIWFTTIVAGVGSFALGAGTGKGR